MNNISEKQILALKAVFYLAIHNRRLKHGGTYVENIKDYENSGKITFAEAVQIVNDFLFTLNE